MPPADPASPSTSSPGLGAKQVDEGLERHSAQNALARAICLIEDALDRTAHEPAIQATLEATIDEIERAGRLIARL